MNHVSRITVSRDTVIRSTQCKYSYKQQREISPHSFLTSKKLLFYKIIKNPRIKISLSLLRTIEYRIFLFLCVDHSREK